jgi:phenylalanyl-tRNA synthetase beta chain
MKVLLSWLEEFVDVPVDPQRLARDLTLVGLAVDAVEERGDDVLLDLDITTNRVDCMNVYGVAREVSVLYDKPLRALDVEAPESGPPASEAWQVEVEAADLCPRFCGRVLDVRIGPSPAWLRTRLEAVGVRPISNLVDLSNYVMMEMGHPSHAFDLDRVPGKVMTVRWARDGERLTTLDGQERALKPGIGVVAGPDGPLALAGIMGGASSEVREETRTVALEAAYWEPLAIRRAAKALGMHTEASHRFERGADPEGPPLCLDRVAHLLARINAGTARPGLIDRYVSRRTRRRATLRPARAAAILGVKVPEAEAARILTGLGFQVRKVAREGIAVEVPTWRGDVSREADLIEEVGRHFGLDKMPSTLPPARGVEGLRPEQVAERTVRDVLAGAGLTEVINYAFVSRAAAESWVPVGPALENPLAEDQSVLRTSLVVPGLLGNLRTNLRQGRRDVRVFELGRVFQEGDPLPVEDRRVALLMAGATPSHWSGKPRTLDFFDLKGAVELLGARLGLPAFRFEREGAPAFLHPGQAATVLHGDQVLGYLGALHPDLALASELRDGGAFIAELALAALRAGAPVRVEPLPRFPAVTRDLSVICDADVGARELEGIVREGAGRLLRQVRVADRYDRPPVPPGKVSVTLSLVFQDPERTLTGEEVQAAVDHLLGALKARGLKISGE